jgi:hypothetical protein
MSTRKAPQRTNTAITLLCVCLYISLSSVHSFSPPARTFNNNYRDATLGYSQHRRGRQLTSLVPPLLSASASSAPAAAAAPDPHKQQQQQQKLRPEKEQSNNDIFSMDYYDPNEIHPKTKTLTGSIAFFATFVLRINRNNRRRKLLLLQMKQSQLKAAVAENKKKQVPSWLKTFRKLNEQRKNIVLLADYTADIVAPSFFFLLLGALMTSIIPHYYSMCIQLVATLDGTTAKVWEALIGLTVASTLGALFTGARGSLFWIAGSRANYNIRVKLHRNLLLQEAAFFDSNETGYLLSRLNSDVNKIGQVISYHVNV